MRSDARFNRLITAIRRTRRLIVEVTALLVAASGLLGVVLSLVR